MKTVSFLFIILFGISASAQNMSGQAYYESKTTIDMDGMGGPNMSEDRKKQIKEMMKSNLEKTYILTFNGNESMYKEQVKLDAGPQNPMMKMMMGSFMPGTQYKNLAENQILEEREFFGKSFLINDTITNLKWEISKESKQIGQYLAIKATATKKIDENDMSFARRRGRDREKDEEQRKADSIAASEDPMSLVEVPKELTVTAWFTPMIPVKNGPSEYAGLPGLILELNIDRTTLLCSKIVMNPKEAEQIEKPSKGKEVSREEFNKIVKDKTEEMRENFRGRGGRRGQGRFGGQ